MAASSANRDRYSQELDMKIEFLNVLLGGILLLTVGLATVFWRLDPRMSSTTASAALENGHGLAPASRLRDPDAELNQAGSEASRKSELSALPIGRHTREENLETMELPKRVQVFHERQNEFRRERMAELLAQDKH
jgi:hypothetical protein